jgi:hypothetical protein
VYHCGHEEGARNQIPTSVATAVGSKAFVYLAEEERTLIDYLYLKF